MEQAQLVTTTDDGKLQCNACQWRCQLGADEHGHCELRVGRGEAIEVTHYGMISAASVGPIEDHRFWHFFPDSLAFSIGGWGSAFPVDLQRGSYARPPEDPEKRRRLDVERAANFALERLCRGVVWAYGDPAVSYEYVAALLRSSRANSRYTAIVTNGFLTTEALDGFGPYLDGLNLDLRGFSAVSYQRLAGITNWRGVLDLAVHAKTRWNCHMEVTTRVHRGVNDEIDELHELVDWIRDMLGPQTPWHVLPGDAGSETAGAVARARRIGHERGLQFIYGHEANQATRCPTCQATLITRENGIARLIGLSADRCGHCDTPINLQLSIFKPR